MELAIILLCTFLIAGSIFLLWRRFAGKPSSRTRTIIRAGAALLIAMTLTGFTSWKLSRARTVQTFGEIIPSVDTPRKIVALTFDDGPVPGATDSILAELADLGVRGTFFVTGAELSKNMWEGSRIVEGGHELGNHTYSHQHMVLVGGEFVEQEIEQTDRLIRDAGHTGEIFFRPPYCHKLLALPWYLRQTGRRTVTWNIEPESYPEIAGNADAIAEHVIRNAVPGSIILLHVMYASRRESLRSVRKIVTGLKEQGYEFVTMSELMAEK